DYGRVNCYEDGKCSREFDTVCGSDVLLCTHILQMLLRVQRNDCF
uniref:Uncharacterized protein n=1 Tax=Salmo trutta TaxID=8032 RepID=A0A674CZT6_SALTR